MKLKDLDCNSFELFYRYDDLSKKVIDLLVEDALAGGFSVILDTEEKKINDMLNLFYRNLNLNSFLYTSLIESRVFGDSYILIDFFDKNYSENITEKQSYKINGLITLKSSEMSITLSSSGEKIYISSSKYGIIDESRLLFFAGNPLPFSLLALNNFKNDSVLLNILNIIIPTFESYVALTNTVKNHSLLQMGIEDIEDLQSVPKTKQDLQELLNILSKVREDYDVIATSKDTLMGRVEASLSGFKDTIIALLKRVSIASGYPEVIFLGSQGGGFNRGDIEFRSYLKKINSYRDLQIEPAIRKLTNYFFLDQMGNAIFKSINKDKNIQNTYKIAFTNPYPLTLEEKANALNLITEADKNRAEAENSRAETNQINANISISLKTAGISEAPKMAESKEDENQDLNDERNIANKMNDQFNELFEEF